MRRLIGPLLLALVAALGLLAGTSPKACACSCATRSTQQYAQDADLVAHGRVLSIGKPASWAARDTVIYRVELSRLYQGTAPARIEVTTAASGASCGLEGFTAGDDIVLFAKGAGSSYDTTLCSGTARASEGLARVEKLLGSGSAPETSLAPAPLDQPASRTPLLLGLAGLVVLTAVLAGRRLRTRRKR